MNRLERLASSLRQVSISEQPYDDGVAIREAAAILLAASKVDVEKLLEPVDCYGYSMMCGDGNEAAKFHKQLETALRMALAGREWQGLTDDEIYQMYSEPSSDSEMVTFAREVEANLREKNTR